MSETFEKACAGCGQSEEQARLERCSGCAHWFCSDCAHRAGFGRKFCSAECSRIYYFSGEPDEDEDDLGNEQ